MPLPLNTGSMLSPLYRMNPFKPGMRSCIWLGILFALLCRSAPAQQSNETLTQFVHTAWTERDGAPKGIQAITQTPDGYLWLGTGGGLYRFDGTTLEPYQPRSGGVFPPINAQRLLALPNGDLWIGYASGAISRLRNGRAQTYRKGDGEITGLIQDRDGTIWAGAKDGLQRFDGNHWEDIGVGWKFSGKSVAALFVDHDGTLWVSTEDTIFFLPRGTRNFQPTSIRIGTVPQITESAQGKLWMAETTRSVRPVPLGNKLKPSDDTEIAFGSQQILFDSAGSLWISTVGDGLRYMPVPEELKGKYDKSSSTVESFTAKNGLTDDVALSMFQDRDGNIWIGTMNGLDRFRRNPFKEVPLPVLHSDPILVPGNQGDVWIFLRDRIFHTTGSRTEEIKNPEPKIDIDTAFHSSTGALWWISDNSIVRFESGQFSKYPLPKQMKTPFFGNKCAAQDRSGVIWLAAEHEGLFRFENGLWKHFDTPAPLMNLQPSAAFKDDSGRIWFGYAGGTLIYLDGDQLHTVATGTDPVDGTVIAIGGRGEHVWVGESSGLAFFDGHKLIRVAPIDLVRFVGGIGIEELGDGSLWLYEGRGMVRIDATEVRKFLETPGYRVHYEIFDTLDKYPGFYAAGQRLVQSTDGRLWFGWRDHVASIDLAGLPKQPAFPMVIRSVTADGKQYFPDENQVLPPRLGRLEIDYAAANLLSPEHIRYRYKLEGSDRVWQDPGKGREAVYTNLGPGKHRFTVQARTEGEWWGRSEAVVEFSIASAWFEMIWFRGLCAGLFILLLYALYKLRLRQLERRFHLTLETRVDERTRIARELHDTLLQSFNGLLLRFQTVSNLLPARPEEAKTRIDSVIEEGSAAITEGRDAVHELRSVGLLSGDLAESIGNFAKELLGNPSSEHSPEFQIHVDGSPKNLNPVVRDEAYRIAAEALRNAIRHADAHRIEVEIRYDQDCLRLRIHDDGKGIDASILDKEHAPGHWGLRGMRERAKLIGAGFDIWSKPGSGTEIELKIPAASAYAKPFASRWPFFSQRSG